MKTFKQIIYRAEDGALMIVPSNDEQVVTRFTGDLSDVQKVAFLNLQAYLLTQVKTLSYAVYTTENNQLDAEPVEGTTVQIPLDSMSVEDRDAIQNVLDICSQLINE